MDLRAVLLVTLLGACSSGAPETSSRPAHRRGHDSTASESAARHTPEAPVHVAPLPPSRYPQPERLVAIGDVHGDLDALLAILRAAGAVDEAGHWSGGALFVVQTGDLLDRGDQEEAILETVDRLSAEASEAGGHFLALNGNHEIMNAQGDFRYVTPGGMADFAQYADEAPRSLARQVPAEARGRVGAFHPGGPMALRLATHLTIVVVGDTLLVHGGATREAIEVGLDRINEGARAFLLGQAPLPPVLDGPTGPIWYRGFAESDDAATCTALAQALEAAQVRRMVVGHTVQHEGVTRGCDERVFRIDVGLGRRYMGPIEALEITAEGTRVIHGAR